MHVEAAHSLDEIAGDKATDAKEGAATEDIEQEDKPRSRIVAEYLAHGYAISDAAIQKAIALDQKHGFSSRFTKALQDFDAKYGATNKAKGIDESYNISDKAASGWRGLNQYFEKALDTPSGQKLREFYVQTNKQVMDIHSEARRLADLKSGKTAEAEKPAAATSGGGGSGNVAPSTASHSEPATATAPTEKA